MYHMLYGTGKVPSPGLTSIWYPSTGGYAPTSATAAIVPLPVTTVMGAYRHQFSGVVGRLWSGSTSRRAVVPATPVVRFRQFTDTATQYLEFVAERSAAKVTTPDAPVVAEGVTVDSGGG